MVQESRENAQTLKQGLRATFVAQAATRDLGPPDGQNPDGGSPTNDGDYPGFKNFFGILIPLYLRLLNSICFLLATRRGRPLSCVTKVRFRLEPDCSAECLRVYRRTAREPWVPDRSNREASPVAVPEHMANPLVCRLRRDMTNVTTKIHAGNP